MLDRNVIEAEGYDVVGAREQASFPRELSIILRMMGPHTVCNQKMCLANVPPRALRCRVPIGLNGMKAARKPPHALTSLASTNLSEAG
jgi:hypothetical protein